MPRPITSHAANSETIPDEKPSSTRPAAISRLETGSTRRPPCTSINRPLAGPRNADSSRPAENAGKIHGVAMPSSVAILLARIAGRYARVGHDLLPPGDQQIGDRQYAPAAVHVDQPA